MSWIRPEDLKYYSEIGVNHFKLQGRYLLNLKIEITPDDLKLLIEKLNIREKEPHIKYSLEKLRGLIDEKDIELVKTWTKG